MFYSYIYTHTHPIYTVLASFFINVEVHKHHQSYQYRMYIDFINNIISLTHIIYMSILFISTALFDYLKMASCRIRLATSRRCCDRAGQARGWIWEGRDIFWRRWWQFLWCISSEVINCMRLQVVHIFYPVHGTSMQVLVCHYDFDFFFWGAHSPSKGMYKAPARLPNFTWESLSTSHLHFGHVGTASQIDIYIKIYRISQPRREHSTKMVFFSFRKSPKP